MKEDKKLTLWKVWLDLGIVCLGYYTGLMIFTGFTNVFYTIWLFIGMLFLIMAWMSKTHFIKRFVPRPVRIVMGILIALGLAVFVFVEGLILSGFRRMPTEEVEYIVVLGAHVKEGKPSRVLQKRLDAAYDYATKHPDVTIIVSGGQGDNETTTEAFVMADYLENKGIKSSRIIKEEKSTSTYENLTFSAALMDDAPKIAVVTNDFHVYRATHIAREAGYDNPQAVAARDDVRTFPANMMREFFGVVKDVYYGNMKLFPIP